MRALSMSGLEPNFGEEDGLFNELRARKAKENELFKKNVEFSFDEAAVGKNVSEFFAAQIPEGRKIDKAKHPTEFAAVNAAFGDDDPRKALMPIVKANYQTLLRNKEFKGADKNQLLDLAYKSTVKGTPSQEIEGATFEDDIHRYKYKQDTKPFGMGDKVAAAPGYDEWLANEKARPMEDRQIGFGENALWWGGFAAAGHALRKPVGTAVGKALVRAGAAKAGEWLIKAAPPQGKLVGAVLAAAAMSIPDTLAGNAIRKTEWYRAREDQPIMRELAAMTVGGLTAGGVGKVGYKQGIGLLKGAAEKGAVTEAQLKNFFKDSTAENIMRVGAARRAEKAALKDMEGLLNNVAGKEEKKIWFDQIKADEESFLKKYNDDYSLESVIQMERNALDEQLKLKSPVESQPFGWGGEENGPTIFGRRPGYTSRPAPLGFEKLEPEFGWKGEGYNPPAGESYPRPEGFFEMLPDKQALADFKVFPNGQAWRRGDQFALEAANARLALPPGEGPGFFGLRNAPVNPPDTFVPPSGGAGGGGIFGLSYKQLLAPFDEIERAFGWTGEEAVEQSTKKSIFGISKNKLEKSFTNLDTDDAAFVIDEVTNRGKTLEESLIGMERTKVLRGAVAKTEQNVAKASETAKTLPPDRAIGYEGTEAAAEAGKAGKVLTLTQEVNAAKPELQARKAVEQKAVKAVAEEAKKNLTLQDVVEGPEVQTMLKDIDDPRLANMNFFDETIPDDKADDLTSGLLEFFGAKFRTERTAVPPMSQERIAEAARTIKEPVEGVAKPGKKVKPGAEKLNAEQRAIQSGIDYHPTEPEFIQVASGKVTQSSYIQKMVENPGYADLEARRIFDMALSKGIPEEQIPNTKIFKDFKVAQEKANFIRGEVLDPVVDDLTEFGGMSVNPKPAAVKVPPQKGNVELTLLDRNIAKLNEIIKKYGKNSPEAEKARKVVAANKSALKTPDFVEYKTVGIETINEVVAADKTWTDTIAKYGKVHPEVEKAAAIRNAALEKYNAEMVKNEADFAARGGYGDAGSPRNILKAAIPVTAVGTMSVAAVLGLPEDSHASVASVIGEAAARGIKALPKAWINTVKGLQDVSKLGHKEIQNKFAQLIKDAEAAGYVSRQVGNSKILPARMKVPDFTTLAKEIYGSTSAAVKTVKSLPMGIERIMSPWARGALHYKTGANPAVHIAAMQTAWTENIKNGYAVLDNIMGGVSNGKTAAREVAKLFEPLSQKYAGVVQSHQIVSTKIKQLEKAIPVMEKVLKDGKLDPVIAEGYTKKLAEARKKLEVYTTHMREDIAPRHAEFMSQHEAVTKTAAKKYASTRVFLAANDTEAFEHYPWLKGMLTKEEQIAATHVKAMMKSYEESAVESGLNVITNRPYMHYSWHPAWKESAAEEFAKSIGMDLPITTVPHNQFHSRMVGAVPMLPDVYHSVQSYIPMAEKILGWRAFWNTKGPKDASWYKHMMSSTVQHNSSLRGFWNAVKDASVPAEQMMVDKWMDRYTAFEVLRLLGGSPSVAYKHFFKNIGTWGSLGFGEAASHMGAAATTAARNKMTSPEGVKWLSKIGIDTTKMTPKFWDDAAKSYTSQMKRLSVLDDIDLRPASQLSWFDNFLGEVNHKAGFMVNAVENYDRVHSFLAAGEMAAKRGLTAKDASYAIYDTILKNNFLGGALNPSWAKSPSVRAIMLFQTTAFKIFERRMVTAIQSGRAIKDAWKEASKMGWNWDKAMSEIKTLKDFVTKGEYEFKKGIITDALAGERDFLGQFAVRQQMREMLYAGVVLGGGAMLGHDYAHHISHLPFVQKSFEGEPVIGFSPIARAIWDTKEGKVYAGEESEFGMVGDFLNNWFRSQGPIPQMVNKAINVSRDDIPEIYREEGFLPKEFRYFWAIPSTKEKE